VVLYLFEEFKLSFIRGAHLKWAAPLIRNNTMALLNKYGYILIGIVLVILVSLFAIKSYGDLKFNDGYIAAQKAYDDSNNKLNAAMNDIRYEISKSNSSQKEEFKKTVEKQNYQLIEILKGDFYNQICVKQEVVESLNNRGKK
jgi:hypothetical protein